MRIIKFTLSLLLSFALVSLNQTNNVNDSIQDTMPTIIEQDRPIYQQDQIIKKLSQ